MKYINKRQYLDLAFEELIKIKVKQKDTARYILFRLLDNGRIFDLTGKSVTFFAKKPDSKEVFNQATITSASNGECEIQLTSQVLAVQGIVECELVIYEEEDILSTFIFELDVKKSLRGNSAIESSNEYSIIEKIIDKMKEWIEKTKEAIKRVDEAINKIPGKDELIPSIGSNGNWFIGGEDTGISTFGAVIEIKKSTDLDNIKKVGCYKCSNPEVVSTLSNCPTENAFTLLVEDLKQTLSEAVASAGAKTWVRSYRNGMWGFWDKNFSEYSKPNADEIIETTNRKFVSGTEKDKWNSKAEGKHNHFDCTIIDNKDLNDYTTEGLQGVTNNNCTNQPTEGYYYIFNMKYNNTNIKQIAYGYNQGQMYTRYRYNGKWSPWTRMYSSTDKPTPADIGAAPISHNHDDRYIRKIRDLGASENLNDITQTGRYHQSSNAGASLALNYPEAKAGLLVVYNDGYVYQEYHTYTNTGVYRRTKYGSTWCKWIKLNGIDTNTVTEGFSNGHVLYNNNGRVGAKAVLTPSDYEVGSGGLVKDISGKDIRTINISGRYRGNRCPNSPTAGSWYFYDIEVHNSTYRKITAKHFFSDNIYICTLNNGVWGEWIKLPTTTTTGAPTYDKNLGEDTGYLELPGGVIMQWATVTQTITKHNGQYWAKAVDLPKVVECIIGSTCSIISASVIQGDAISGLVASIDSKVETKTQSSKTMSRISLVWGKEDQDANTSIEVKARVLVFGYNN